MNTKAIGDISEQMVAAFLLRAGKVILRPFGDNQRYDLVIDEDGKFSRIQCKTGRIINGSISFKTCSSYAHRGRCSKSYAGEIEFFGVYCPDNDRAYLVPIDGMGKSEAHLRIDETKNNQANKVRWAKDYTI